MAFTAIKLIALIEYLAAILKNYYIISYSV